MLVTATSPRHGSPTTDSGRLELDAYVVDGIRRTVDDLTVDRPLTFARGVDADAVEHHATALLKALRHTALASPLRLRLPRPHHERRCRECA